MGLSFLTDWCVLRNVCFIFTTLPSRPLYGILCRHFYSNPPTLSLVSGDFWNNENSHATKLISLRLCWQILLLIEMEPWAKLLTLTRVLSMVVSIGLDSWIGKIIILGTCFIFPCGILTLPFLFSHTFPIFHTQVVNGWGVIFWKLSYCLRKNRVLFPLNDDNGFFIWFSLSTILNLLVQPSLWNHTFW